MVESMIEIEDFYGSEVVEQSSAPLVGLELKPARTFPLVDNIHKKRISKRDIGSNKWLQAQLLLARKKNYRELKPLIGTQAAPITPPAIKHLEKGYKRPLVLGGSNPWVVGQKLPKRLEKAALRLRECPREWLSFVTIVTSAQFSIEATKEALEADGKKLERFLRKRMPNARMVCVPEVSIHRLSEMHDGLFPDARWKMGKSPDQVVYKVHFHCVFYCMGKTPRYVEHCMQFHKSKKRTPYSGDQQVRALPLKAEPNSGRRKSDARHKPDVLGVFGYSTKGHYKAPNKKSTFDAFPEWLVIQSFIHDNDDLIRVINMQKKLSLTCSCGTKHLENTECQSCENTTSRNFVDEFYNDDLESETVTDDSITSDSEYGSDNHIEVASTISLNCARPTHWQIIQNSMVGKKLTELSTWIKTSVRRWSGRRGP